MVEYVFETKRCAVRRWRDSDLDSLVAVYGDPGAMQWVGDGRPITEGECRDWLAVTRRNYERRGYGMFAVELKGDSRVIGFCGIVHPGDQAEAEIKYAYRREVWRRGLATEVLIGLINYGSTAHSIERYIAITAPENHPSHAVLMKGGFRRGQLEPDQFGDMTQHFVFGPLESQ